MMWRGIASILGVAIFSVATLLMYRITITESRAPLMVTAEEIRRIDAEAFRLVARARLSEDATFALYERLARLEALYIERLLAREENTTQHTKELAGSIAPLAEKVLCDAMPQECVYIWKTFNDYHAASDEIIRADTEFILREEGVRTDGFTATTTEVSSSALPEGEQARYDEMLTHRTPTQARASLIWYAGEGTRRTPGVLLDLLSGYLLLDDARSVADFASIRSRILTGAHQVYLSSKSQNAVYVSPRKEESSFPSVLKAVSVAIADLTPYLSEQGRKDLATELIEARNALWWSGAYYEYAINDAMKRTK